MSGAAFLLIAVAVGVLGALVVTLRNHQTQRPDNAMLEFRREMEALAPPAPPVADGEDPPSTRPPFPGTEPRDGSRPDAGSGAR